MANVRIRHVRPGKTVYVASPYYDGLEKWVLQSGPVDTIVGSKDFVNVKATCLKSGYELKFMSQRSLKDAGIIPNNYNGARSFTKLSEAKRWLKQAHKDPSLIDILNPKEDSDFIDMDWGDYWE